MKMETRGMYMRSEFGYTTNLEGYTNQVWIYYVKRKCIIY